LFELNECGEPFPAGRLHTVADDAWRPVKPDPVVCAPESALTVPAVSTGDDPGALLRVMFSKVQASNTVALARDAPDMSCADVVSL